MQSFPQTLIVRHRKENLNKCSLRGLESRSDMKFFKYPGFVLPDLSRYVLLTPDAPVLSLQDKDRGLLLLDGTWRYAEKMVQWVEQEQKVEKRSLPLTKTAYPRCQGVETGLASIEALYVAYLCLERDTEGLLDNYYWANSFLEKNNLGN